MPDNVDDYQGQGALTSIDGLKRSVQLYNSPYRGLNFCQGAIAEMLDKPDKDR